jgi:hypothetical protein
MPYFFACVRNLLAEDEKAHKAARYQEHLMAEAKRPALPMHQHPIWTQVAAQLRDTLTPENYIKWIWPTRVIAQETDHLTIQAPDHLHAMWLSAKLERQIRDALERMGYPEMRITYVAKDAS